MGFSHTSGSICIEIQIILEQTVFTSSFLKKRRTNGKNGPNEFQIYGAIVDGNCLYLDIIRNSLELPKN